MLLLALWLVAATGTPPETDRADAPPEVSAGACVCCGPEAVATHDLVAAEDWHALRGGSVLRSTRRIESASGLQGGASVTSLLPWPPDQVWAVLTDFESWPEFMPHVTATRITRREGQRQWVQQDFRILLTSLRHTTIYGLDPRAGQLRWELDLAQPHDIAGSRGHWQLSSADGGRATLLRYSAAVESGRQVPAFVERLLVERSIDDLFASLRDELERRYGRTGGPPIESAPSPPRNHIRPSP